MAGILWGVVVEIVVPVPIASTADHQIEFVRSGNHQAHHDAEALASPQEIGYGARSTAWALPSGLVPGHPRLLSGGS